MPSTVIPIVRVAFAPVRPVIISIAIMAGPFVPTVLIVMVVGRIVVVVAAIDRLAIPAITAITIQADAHAAMVAIVAAAMVPVTRGSRICCQNGQGRRHYQNDFRFHVVAHVISAPGLSGNMPGELAERI